jgi:hypothetical protein
MAQTGSCVAVGCDTVCHMAQTGSYVDVGCDTACHMAQSGSYVAVGCDTVWCKQPCRRTPEASAVEG